MAQTAWRDEFTREQLGQVLELLLVRGVAHDLVDTQIAVRAVAQGDRARRPAELLLGQRPASAGCSIMCMVLN